MRKTFMAVSMAVALLTLSGCTAVLIGAGVAGGVAISEDTAKLELDTSYARAWNVTYDILKDMGAIEDQDKDSGKIVASVQGAHVEAKVLPVTSKIVRIEVKARKNLLPKMDVAMDIINRINSKF